MAGRKGEWAATYYECERDLVKYADTRTDSWAKVLCFLTNNHQCFKPIPTLIGELNRHLKGWVNNFSFGYPSSAYCEIDRHVQGRLIQHLQRRSQRPYRPPQGEFWLRHLTRLGLIRLSGTAHA